MDKFNVRLIQGKLSGSVQSPTLQGKLSQTTTIVMPQKHNELENLDFENSGHTGFASEEQVELLLPSNISVLPRNNLANRDAKIYLYDPSVEGGKTQCTVGELLDSKIQTVSAVPDNLQLNDYIFLEVKDNG